MTRNRIPASLLTAALLAVAACTSGAGASPAPGATLEGSAWSVESIGGQPTIEAARPTMAFAADGNVSGFAGCNQFNGTYTVDGDKLTVGPLGMTRMACAENVNLEEQAFVGALQGATNWAIGSDGKLTIRGVADIVGAPEAGASTAAPSGAVTDLAGTSWQLVDLGSGMPESPNIPAVAFAADGTVSGTGGCNNFSGTYTTDGSSITIGALASTMMACVPDVVMTLETEFTTALQGATTWRIDDQGQLILEGGGRTVTLTPA